MHRYRRGDFAAWLSQARKTVAVRADSPACGARRVFHVADLNDTACNYISIWTDAAEAKVTVASGGSLQAELTLGTVAPRVPFILALSLANNDARASLDGAAELTDSSAIIPPCDSVWFGSGPSGEQLCGHLSGEWRFFDDTGDVKALSA